ncbi:MAG: hypothetical protein OES84_06155, partial [Kiritimatiellaceae bacterium]|nr:hypothetical protein [Kiritimatiellaceae bacterium]
HFLGYRYIIGRRRTRIVNNYELIHKIEETGELDPTTRDATLYILRSIVRSKEIFNYAFICLLSLIALVLDFFAD